MTVLTSIVFLAAIVAATSSAADAGPRQTWDRRWVYLNTNMLVEKNAKQAHDMIERTAAVGFNGVVLADSKTCTWFPPDFHMPSWEQNVKSLRNRSRQLGLAIIGGDRDDIGALAVLHSLAGSGEADILAIMVSGGGHTAKAMVPSVSKGKVRVIFDTDMAGDWDDCGATAVLHALADLGEAEILGMGVNIAGRAAPWTSTGSCSPNRPISASS